MKQIEFTVDGLKLKGNLIYPATVKDKNPTILFVHGWTSAKERSYQYAEALSKLGFICFLFDMRGHGQSEGDIKAFTIREFLDDVLAAYDYLTNVKGVDKDNISAIGSSFGGYLISLLSEKRNVKNLSMRVPADYPNEEFDQLKYQVSGSNNPQIVSWRNKVRKPNETYALQALHAFKGNIQIIESEKDTVVPHQTIANYINAVPDRTKLTHVVIKDAPHSIKEGVFRDRVEQILVNWMSNKL